MISLRGKQRSEVWYYIRFISNTDDGGSDSNNYGSFDKRSLKLLLSLLILHCLD